VSESLQSGEHGSETCELHQGAMKLCMSVSDAECLGCSTTASTTKNEERAMELILENRRVTVDKTAKQLNKMC
jgi:hypothetical protein